MCFSPKIGTKSKEFKYITSIIEHGEGVLSLMLEVILYLQQKFPKNRK